MELLTRINAQKALDILICVGVLGVALIPQDMMAFPRGNTLWIWNVDPVTDTIMFLVILIIGISSWVVGKRMRRRIKNDLGKTADEGDLTSLETWMKVDEVEEKKNPGRAWVPESSPSDYESTKRDL